MIAATVVPHEPAPITATDVWDPTLGSIRGPMFPDASRAPTSGAVIPIRAFALGKARLAASLDGAERAALGRRWAEQVVHAAGADADRRGVVGSRRARLGHRPRRSTCSTIPGSLDGAAAVGRDHLRARGCSRVVVAHADLPRAHDLARLARDASQPVVALVPCHRDDGTPVLSVPTERRLPLRLRTRIVPSPRGRGTPARSRAAGRARPRSRVRRRRPRRPGRAGRRRSQPRGVVTTTDAELPRPGPRDRRPSRRHRVRVRRDAREVGARRLARGAARAHRRIEGHLGTRPGPRRARGHPQRRATRRRPHARRPRRALPRRGRRRARSRRRTVGSRCAP